MTTGARPFQFDTVFDDGGDVIAVAPPRPKRHFSPEEVEAVRAHAFAEGQASSMAQAEAAAAQALAELAEAARHGLSALAAVAHAHKEGCAALAQVCAGRIADAALEAFPEAPLRAALEALTREVESAPRLMLKVRSADDKLRAALEGTAADVGFAGAIVVREEPGAPAAGFVLEWPDGKAVFDPAAAATRIDDALASALAAEGLHGDRLTPEEF
jgi:flagellar assembly protein FliH